MLIGPWGLVPVEKCRPYRRLMPARVATAEMLEPSSAAVAFADYFSDGGRPISAGNISSGVIPVISR